MKVRIVASIGILMFILGLGTQIIQYQEEIDNLNEKLDNALIEIDRLEAENESLWDNYYMNVSNYEGYEYYE